MSLFNLQFDTLLYLLSGILSLAIIIFACLKGRKSPLLFSFIWYLSAIFSSSLSFFLENAANHSIRANLLYLALRWYYIFFGLSFLIFALTYTNHKKILQKRWLMTGLFFPPVLIYLLILFNQTRPLFFIVGPPDYIVHLQPFYWYPEIVTFIYSTIAIIFLFKYCVQQYRLTKRRSTLLIFVATLILSLITVTNLVDLTFKFSPFLSESVTVSITFLCIYLSAYLFSVATFKYRFLNVSAAFKQMVESIPDPVFFIDSLNQIIYYNCSFRENFAHQSPINLPTLIQHLKKKSQETPELEQVITAIQFGATEPVRTELCWNLTSGQRYFRADIEPIIGKSGEPLGRVVSFHDITEYRKLTSQLNHRNLEITAMNEELVLKNEQLKEYSTQVAELTIRKERTRFARDTHDTIGHTMTILIAGLESLKITCKKDPSVVEKLTAIINTARAGLNEARRTIHGLAPGNLAEDDLSLSLKQLIDEFHSMDVAIDLAVEGSIENCDPLRAEAIYRICQESITNAVRHGKATHIHIILNFETDWVRLFIFDDGLGCKKIHKGLGLTGMETRVAGLQGVIKYGPCGENGFVVNVTIPLEKSSASVQ